MPLTLSEIINFCGILANIAKFSVQQNQFYFCETTKCLLFAFHLFQNYTITSTDNGRTLVFRSVFEALQVLQFHVCLGQCLAYHN